MQVSDAASDVNFEGHLTHSEVACRLATFLTLFYALSLFSLHWLPFLQLVKGPIRKFLSFVGMYDFSIYFSQFLLSQKIKKKKKKKIEDFVRKNEYFVVVCLEDCGDRCRVRCSLHSRPKICGRACGTCCSRCNCVPPGTYGNREVCGKCYTDMMTHGNKPKCP